MGYLPRQPAKEDCELFLPGQGAGQEMTRRSGGASVCFGWSNQGLNPKGKLFKAGGTI